MKPVFTLIAFATLALSIFAPGARADGDAHCKFDDAVTFKCLCAQNGQRFVAASKCFDQTGRNFKKQREAFEKSCLKRNNATTSCEVLR